MCVCMYVYYVLYICLEYIHIHVCMYGVFYVCVCVYICIYLRMYAVAQLVEALRYKPEGRGFDSR